ncbi:flavin-containing monooxygenase [Sphingomonas solaris]|uniref:NAD(P)/FAD-dependent oxidoreductase n=1 Tax=Alterirhizorhabdus solaris TaxID=2529389 RepID=A0A558RBJ7_9SPHN|nr:NAD(P)/FAD-dependent oxidoreductase [Sphingomonas solaris]TVV76730.1 NAD(P)/FAD-dependent oxidoreductase [Sphingomonas solaris]
MTSTNDAQALKALVSDRANLREALKAADIAPLLMVLVHLGGDPAWLDRVQPYIKGPWSFHEEAPEALKAELREALVDLLADYAATGRALPVTPPMELLPHMLDVCVGQHVPPEYYPLVLEEMDLAGEDPKTVKWREPAKAATLADFKVLVIGAGFSGVAMGIKLKEAGIPFSIIEKNDSVGGTWYENSYPGCGVDTANHFYSYSFDNNHDWDHFFAKRDEIYKYIRRNAEKHRLAEQIRYNIEVTSTVWDDDAALWRVEARDSEGKLEHMTANVVVSAVGQLNRPSLPDIPGLSDFEGPAFHTARWNHEADIAGRRVGMIGTGASGMQVGPAIAPIVDHLTIFQRSPHWAMHNPLYFETVTDEKKWVLKNIPFYGKWFRFQLFWSSSDGFHSKLRIDPDWADKAHTLNADNAEVRKQLEAHIAKEVNYDPELIRKATPDYPPYGKRMLRDNHWYRMLVRPNVELVDTGIDHVEKDAVVTKDGVRHEVDVLVLATGFQARRLLTPMHVEGKDGVTIRESWGEDDPRAHFGITVPKFPNLFLIYGPNTNLAHGGSAVFHSECQIRYIMQGIRELIETNSAALEVKDAPFWEYQDKVDEAHRGMVWSHPGVTSWYKNKNGRVTANSPWRLVDYRNLTETFEPSEYDFRPADDKTEAAA